MPLNKTGLKNEIKMLMEDMMQREQTSIDEFADRLADAVDMYVKTATVTVAFPIPVTVVPATGLGGTTASGTGTIS